MHRTAFLASLGMMFLGLLLLSGGLLTRVLLPRLGYAMFMFAHGSYLESDWQGGLTLDSLLALAATMAIGGYLTARRLYLDRPAD